MTRELVVLGTLIAYAVVLLVIGYWASRRTKSAEDFFIGGRTLGPIVAAISASASSSSAWTLLGVSGAAFAWGWPALWLFPATVMGFVINWFWVAPRIRRLADERQAVTLTELLVDGARGADTASRLVILRSAALVIIVSFTFYIASQFQAAGNAFAGTFDINPNTAVVTGGLIVLAYTYAGGFWAASVTDTLQGLLMAATAIVLPLGAFIAAGGIDGLVSAASLDTSAGAGSTQLPGFAGPAALGFVCGTLGIGLGYPGQPHVVNRLMAIRDQNALRIGRIVALSWAVVVYAGMIVLGLSGRALASTLADGEQVFFALANSLHSPVLSAVMIAAVLSAIMSTADSQLLVATSSLTYDWRGAPHGEVGEKGHRGGLASSRRLALLLSVLAVALAIAAPASIFSRVLFGWHAVGSAFGPALILVLAGFSIDSRRLLWSIWVGFAGTVVLHWFPDTPGDWAERLIPLALSAAIAISGCRKE